MHIFRIYSSQLRSSNWSLHISSLNRCPREISSERVDVVILEVGLGGKFDATNVIREPVVCGISSLGYDHMEILGHTLAEIAAEKAGISKSGVPAFTVPQPKEAMRVLNEKASKLEVNLQVVEPLDSSQRLGLRGEHQYLNAGLAVALCSTFLQKIGIEDKNGLNQISGLPEKFISGLSNAYLMGRAMIVPDSELPEEILFYLDGARSPERMEACATWFSQHIKQNRERNQKRSEQCATKWDLGQTLTHVLIRRCGSLVFRGFGSR